MKSKDPYKTLGVDKNADATAIKKAHRKGSKKTHPDTGGNKEEFLAIQRAYEILSDDDARQRFDETGDTEPPKDLEHQAMTELAQICIRIIDMAGDVTRLDMMKSMQATIRKTIKETEESKEGCLKRVAKYQNAAGRFKTTGDKPNIFKDMLENQAAKLKALIIQQDSKIKLCQKCLEILNDFDYKFETVVDRFTQYKSPFHESKVPNMFEYSK